MRCPTIVEGSSTIVGGPHDPDFHGQRRADWEQMRWDNDVRVKEAFAFALIEAIDHCRRATQKAQENGQDVCYHPMAFVAEWAVDGGRNGALAAFNAEKLKTPEYVRCLSMAPSRRDDDKPMLALAKTLISAGHEVLLVTKDMFRDHIRDGDITQEWFDQHVVSYMWLNSERFFINLPHDLAARMPHLQDGGMI